jgi:hypothetical protein
MRSLILKFNFKTFAYFFLILMSGAVNGVGMQTTNSIPASLFLTDDGNVFWYKPGQRLVDVQKIEEAKKSPESRPADQDSEGHWGSPANGLQLSLRLEKQSFTNNEPVKIIMLMRNVTNQPVAYFRPTSVTVTKNGKLLRRKDDTGILEITMSPETRLFPQTQHRYQENLSAIYDLSEAGEYILQATCSHPEVVSQKVSIVITNFPVSAP